MNTTSRKIVNTSYQILGVEVDALSIPLAVTQIITKAADSSSQPSYVVKPYVEFLEKAISEPELLAIFNDAEWCLADGISLIWAAHYLYGGRRHLGRLLGTLGQIILMPRRLRKQLPQNIGGITFTWPLLEAARDRGLSVYLIGSPKHNDIAHTAATLTRKLPGLSIAGYFSGHFDRRLEAKLATELQKVRPDIILVGMGFPRQEQLILRLIPQLEHGVLIGEGGTFDYQQFGGRAPKAPGLIGIIGLEWLWRLILQPSRIKRQLAIPRFIWHIYGQGRDMNLRAKKF